MIGHGLLPGAPAGVHPIRYPMQHRLDLVDLAALHLNSSAISQVQGCVGPAVTMRPSGTRKVRVVPPIWSKNPKANTIPRSSSTDHVPPVADAADEVEQPRFE